MISEKKTRVTISISKELLDEVQDVAGMISQERKRKCTKSELCEIALTAFVVGYYNEKPKTERN